ncbi:LysR family transcriptional regulator [Kineococcus radiotolerans]|uniref:LysR family transcriptional regulator n=1 Tax=Kineococcus radiotolerans TaxID=131568 RepID=UPI00003A4936|nr:LysR family transcriptional regulator [Kineococcus radiotolerans]
MELRQLEVFLAVVEAGTISAAARRLGTAQSVVSTVVRALEEDLGAGLFVRTSRRAVPTDAGRALVPEARRLLAGVSQARAAVRGAEEGPTGPVAVGVVTTMHPVDLPRLLQRFTAEHPRVSVSMRVFADGSRGLLRALVEGELDAAFLSWPFRPPGAVALRPLVRAPLRLLLPAGHPLASPGPVELADLAGERWIDGPPGFGNRLQVDAVFERAGARRHVVLEVPDVSTFPRYVAAGLGPAFVPGSVPVPPGCHEQAVTGEQPGWTLSLATARPSPERPARRAVTAFVEAVERDVRRVSTRGR